MPRNKFERAILKHFLELFRIQSRVSPKVRGNISVVLTRADGKEHVCELSLVKDDTPLTRRMTIASLGESGGGKSRCFKVIYDNLMVIKIPSIPVTDFRKYIENIRNENRIASRLGPEIPYVSPGISALLKKIYRFQDEKRLDSLELENRYVQWIQDNPKYLNFLKIDNSFIYYMDLARHKFLSSALSEMHCIKDFQKKLKNEMTSVANSIMKPEASIDSVKMIKKDISKGIEKAWDEYNYRVYELVQNFDSKVTINSKAVWNWFLQHLSSSSDSSTSVFLSEVFDDKLKKISGEILEKHSKAIESFKKALDGYLSEREAVRNFPKIKGIISNLLELIILLEKKNLAIRDLKPDNLFIVGNPDLYPFFLEEPGSFSLGLIDFETGIVTQPIPGREIEQPILGGTPSYATPTHFFHNILLKKHFPDLIRIYYLQDLFAVIGMIFKICTGKCLFETTKDTLKKMLLMRSEFTARKIPLSEVLKYGSRMFWHQAIEEFDKKCDAHAKILKGIQIDLTPNKKDFFQHALIASVNIIQNAIQKSILSQTFFNSFEIKKHLAGMPSAQIPTFQAKAEKTFKRKHLDPKRVEQMKKFFHDIRRLKSRGERLRKQIEVNNRPSPHLNAYEILQILFQYVLIGMYKQEWGKLSSYRPGKANETPGDHEGNDETTIVEPLSQESV